MPFLDWGAIEHAQALDLMEAAADMMLRHCEALHHRPPYETKAEDGLQKCETALQEILVKIHLAQAMYRDKEVKP